jgi:hypothetical protein
MLEQLTPEQASSYVALSASRISNATVASVLAPVLPLAAIAATDPDRADDVQLTIASATKAFVIQLTELGVLTFNCKRGCYVNLLY